MGLPEYKDDDEALQRSRDWEEHSTLDAAL
jgi:hypothetical protein